MLSSKKLLTGFSYRGITIKKVKREKGGVEYNIIKSNKICLGVRVLFYLTTVWILSNLNYDFNSGALVSWVE